MCKALLGSKTMPNKSQPSKTQKVNKFQVLGFNSHLTTHYRFWFPPKVPTSLKCLKQLVQYLTLVQKFPKQKSTIQNPKSQHISSFRIQIHLQFHNHSFIANQTPNTHCAHMYKHSVNAETFLGRISGALQPSHP